MKQNMLTFLPWSVFKTGHIGQWLFSGNVLKTVQKQLCYNMKKRAQDAPAITQSCCCHPPNFCVLYDYEKKAHNIFFKTPEQYVMFR